jgi:rhamnogalacturonyl hydrolase YesR
MNDVTVVENALRGLADWVDVHNWTGYDPYDLKAHPLYLRLQRSRLTALPAKAAANLFPLALRRLLCIEPLPHPKAMALFADAYLTLFDVTGEPTYRTLAEERLSWLVAHASPNHTGLTWGLPFDYQGRNWWPAGTPSVVITSIAARALLHADRLLNDPSYLEAARNACRFFVSDIPRYEPDTHRLCFSKQPTTLSCIHNANLMVAATLAQISRAAGTEEWDDLIRRAVNYTLVEQRKDGAWYYWGPPEPLMHWIDHYHTGFVLRALDDLLRTTGWSELREPLGRGYAFYIHHLFDEEAIPHLTEARRYPVDIHSCAEAILCLTQLSDRYDDAWERAQAVTRWTLAHMRDPAGYFYYRRYRWLTIRIPYMRWAQAWMMNALARYVEKTRSAVDTTEAQSL